MSFNNSARRVRNPELSLKERDSALRSCLALMVGIVGERHSGLRAAYMPWIPEAPTNQQLMNAMSSLEIARNRHLEKLRAFERKRIREKMRGRRQPRRKDLDELRRIETPSAPELPAPRKTPA